jgi:hypothetical protein
MSDQETKIRETILTTAVEDWLGRSNPFSDIVFKDDIVKKVVDKVGDVDENDVEYVWKLMTEEGYFRKRGSSRRITAKEIDAAQKFGVDTPLDSTVQEEILKILKDAERKDVNHPEVDRDDLLEKLGYEPSTVDFNVFYCKSKGWAEVKSFIEEDPWRWAEITRYGRNQV